MTPQQQPRLIVAAAVPDPGLATEVAALAEAAAMADAVPPYDEHTLLSLRPSEADEGAQRHITLRIGTDLLGYAHLDIAQPGEPASAELAVHPFSRRQGLGTALLAALSDVHQQTRPAREALAVWAHGDGPAARVVAGQHGYVAVRALIQMRRPLPDPADEPIAVPELPSGVTVRAFRPGQDDAAWLALNARAFVHHPEQGQMTQGDLDARTAETWFDPEGFFIAEQAGEVIGFHWTKVHPASEDPGGEAMGEVYVLGIDPGHHGGGLGKALTWIGLRHLQDAGLRTVLLYVESDNEPALAVYRRLEFTPFRTDVMYRSADG